LRQTIEKWMNLEEKDLRISYEELNEIFDKRVSNSRGTTKDFYDAIIYSAREILPDKNYDTHKMWIEKCTGADIFVNEIFKMYKNTKFIHILRDPRDNWAVIKSGWDKHYHKQYDSMERLMRSVIDRNYIQQKMAIDNQKIYGSDKYMVLKYEDLVTKPKKKIKQVCEFIELDYDKINLQPTFCGIPWKGNSLSDITYNGVNDNRVSIYKKLPDYDIKLLEYYFRDFMTHFGYEPLFEPTECVDSVREHYKWFNYNQQWSMKPLRTNYKHLEEKSNVSD
ncbi:MAG: sulfotransferase family protein, partial [Petrotogales bacterium]